MMPGRSQKRTSTNSTPSSFDELEHVLGVRLSTLVLPSWVRRAGLTRPSSRSTGAYAQVRTGAGRGRAAARSGAFRYLLPQCERPVNGHSRPVGSGVPVRPAQTWRDAAQQRLRAADRRGARGALRPALVHRRARPTEELRDHARRAGDRPRGGHDLRRLGDRGLQPGPGVATCSPCPTRTRSRSCPGAATTRPSARMFCDIQQPRRRPFEGDPRHVLSRNLERAREKGFTFYVGPGDGVLLLRAPATPPEPARPRRLTSTSPSSTWRATCGADHPHARGDGHPRRVQLPRERSEPARDRPALHRRAHDGRQRHDVPAGREGGRQRSSACTRRSCPSRSPGVQGSGMHTHLSLFEGDVNAFHDPGDEYGLSKVGQGLHRRPAAPRREITAVTNQTVNSYKRLIAGYEAPVLHVLGPQQPFGARAGAARRSGARTSSTRIEFRSPDPGVQPVPRVLGDARGRARRASRRATSCRPRPRTTSSR